MILEQKVRKIVKTWNMCSYSRDMRCSVCSTACMAHELLQAFHEYVDEFYPDVCSLYPGLCVDHECKGYDISKECHDDYVVSKDAIKG